MATRSTYTGTMPCAVVADSVTRYATERSETRGNATLRSETRSTPCFANSRRRISVAHVVPGALVERRHDAEASATDS